MNNETESTEFRVLVSLSLSEDITKLMILAQILA